MAVSFANLSTAFCFNTSCILILKGDVLFNKQYNNWPFLREQMSFASFGWSIFENNCAQALRYNVLRGVL